MSKRSIQVQETMYCGIDVSAKSLTVAIRRVHQPIEQRSLPNNPNGHRALIVWLRKAKSAVRASLEATGIYSLDLAFALETAGGDRSRSLESQGRQSICSNYTTIKNGCGRRRGVS